MARPFRSSSVAEQAAVNRRVGGSKPSSGAFRHQRFRVERLSPASRWPVRWFVPSTGWESNMTSPDSGKKPKVGAGRPVKDSVTASTRATPKARKPTKRTVPQGNVLATLPAAMTGRASPGRAAVGGEPVFAYISSLPQPQRSIVERVDALAAKTLPALQRCVKWGMAWYGVGDGWCFSCGGFAGHVKLTFGRGTSLTPVPPVTPIGMGKESRGVDLESVDDIDERQLASWMRQATALPGFGKR